MIFKNIKRSEAQPQGHNETKFDFLNRSATIEAHNERNFIEKRVHLCPDDEKNNIIGRIISKKDDQFRSACFELILFAILREAGFCVDFHPTLSNGNPNQPDFKVSTPSGMEFYLEAVCPSNRSDIDKASANREAAILDAIDGICIEGFYLSVDIIGYGNASPSTKKLRRDLIQWIESLDPTSIILTKDANSLPMHVWKCEEWEIQFEAIPIRPDAEQRPRRPIGALIGGARLGNSWEPIRDAILNKGTRYGDLDAPLLVAVNADAFNIDRDDEMQALFGGDQVTRYPDKQSQLTRARNGAWFGPGGPRCTRVAGVWIFNDITPRSIAERRGTLYFNPYRDFSLPQELTRFSHAVAVDREIERREGVSLREALNLPINWPSV